MRNVRPLLSTAFVLASSMLLAACPLLSSATTTSAQTDPVALAVVQGNGQIAQAGRAVASPVVLRVLDANGRGVAKQTASLVVLSGGGSVTPSTVVSDSIGEMRVNWTLGTSTPTQWIVATVKGSISINVSATGLFPESLVVAQGAAQTGKIATVLKNDIVVRVVGPGNQPMVSIPVTFTVTAGGGAISPQSGITNSLGEISTKWTLGGTTGTNSIAATAGSLAPHCLVQRPRGCRVGGLGRTLVAGGRAGHRGLGAVPHRLLSTRTQPAFRLHLGPY